jgi:hypothetical protein
MLNHFEILPFLMGFLIGVVGILFWKDKPHVVVKYPHPKEAKGIVFRDPNGTCYTYKSKEVSCDTNETTLKPYPLQEGLPGMND